MSNVEPETVRQHLGKLLASEQLGKADASCKLLTYLVERSLKGETPKEVEIAIDVFGKDASFNATGDSLVRVHVRTLRQRLAEYYAESGQNEPLRFVIPKGSYRVNIEPRFEQPPAPPAVNRKPRRGFAYAAAAVLTLLAGSIALNVYLWNRAKSEMSATTPIRTDPIWADLIESERPLTVVLGDFFMYTQIDPKTGRTLTVRDPWINSSEQLRAFLASDPSLVAERGQRYNNMIAKSTAIGMAAILPIVHRAGRTVEVRTIDDLAVEDIRNNDIIYIGPFVRLGSLVGYYLHNSRYRYDAQTLDLTDMVARKSYFPAGELGDERLDHGIVAKFQGPTGNRIMILASVGRNVGLLQIVQTLTSPQGLENLRTKLREQALSDSGAFEALFAIKGFKRTDLGAEIVRADALPAPRPQPQLTTKTTPAGL